MNTALNPVHGAPRTILSAVCISLTSSAERTLAAPLSRRAAGAAPPSVLVTLTGERRGGPLAWASLRLRLLEPLDADLALFCDGECAAYGGLHALARYSWVRQSPAERGAVWDEILARRPNGSVAMRIAAREDDKGGRGGWGGVSAKVVTELCQDPRSLATVRCASKPSRAGSGAILMESQAQLLGHLRASGALGSYEHFVFTRPDVLYVCDYPPPALLLPAAEPGAERRIAVPFEDGARDSDETASDKHALVRRGEVDVYLGTLERALRNTAAEGTLWCGDPCAACAKRDSYPCSPKSLLRAQLRASGVGVRRLKLPLLLVREPSEERRGRSGMFDVDLAWLLEHSRERGPCPVRGCTPHNASDWPGFDRVARPKLPCCPKWHLPPAAAALQCLNVKLECLELCPALASPACAADVTGSYERRPQVS